MDKRTNQVDVETRSYETPVFAGRIRKEVPAALSDQYETIDKDIFVVLSKNTENWVKDGMDNK